MIAAEKEHRILSTSLPYLILIPAIFIRTNNSIKAPEVSLKCRGTATKFTKKQSKWDYFKE